MVKTVNAPIMSMGEATFVFGFVNHGMIPASRKE
jgi:hypothetical protein